MSARGYSVFAQYYDKLTQNVNYKKRAAYFDKIVDIHAPELHGGILLDLACGTGSLSFELASLGYDVIGVDGSGEMLSVAMQKTAEYGNSPLFLNQTMQRLDLYGTVDITVCALDSLNHLPDEKAFAKAVERVALFTNDDGLFIFDVNTAYKHREILADNAYVYQPDELFCVWQNSYDKSSGDVLIELDFFLKEKSGLYKRNSESFTERIFTHEQITNVLSANGFEIVAVYGDDSFEPVNDTTQRIIYTAKKLKLRNDL